MLPASGKPAGSAGLLLRVEAIFFFSNEGHASPHIHIERAGAVAKFWLMPVCLATSSLFREHELRRLEREVIEHRREFLEAWREHFWT